MTGVFIVLALIAVYLLPTIVAASRKTHNSNGVLILNLLLGWTIVGWIAALVMACGSRSEETPGAAKKPSVNPFAVRKQFMVVLLGIVTVVVIVLLLPFAVAEIHTVLSPSSPSVVHSVDMAGNQHPPGKSDGRSKSSP